MGRFLLYFTKSVHLKSDVIKRMAFSVRALMRKGIKSDLIKWMTFSMRKGILY